jgi:transcription antitermination factor NusG
VDRRQGGDQVQVIRGPYASFDGRGATVRPAGEPITVLVPVVGHHPRLEVEPDDGERVQ